MHTDAASGLDRLKIVLKRALARAERLKWKRDNPYVADLIAVLSPHKNGLERQRVIAEMEAKRREKGLPIPKTFPQTIQSAFQGYASEYRAYRGTSEAADLFYLGRWQR